MRIFPNILHYPFLHYLCRDSSLSLSMSRPVSTKEGPPGGEILALDAPTDQLVPLRRSAPKKKSSGGGGGVAVEVGERTWQTLRDWNSIQWLHVKERLRPPLVNVKAICWGARPTATERASCLTMKRTSIGVWNHERIEEKYGIYYNIDMPGSACHYHDRLRHDGYDMLPNQTVVGALAEYGDDFTNGAGGWWDLPLQTIYDMFSQITEEEGFDPDRVTEEGFDDDDDDWPIYEEWRASLTPRCHRELRTDGP